MDTRKHKSKMRLNNIKFTAKTRRCKALFSAGNFLFIVLIMLLSSCNINKDKGIKNELLLPVYGPKKVSTQGGTDTTYHTIADFSFTNQYKELITQKNTVGKIYIANFFFATCQNICPVIDRKS